MAVEITMPQLSDTMSEGRILVWRKKEGDAVKRGEALAEVATDKADLEIESFHQGQLLKIFASEGTTVKVGSVIAVIGEAGENVQAPIEKVAPPTAVAPSPEPAPAPVAAQPAPFQPMHADNSDTDGERVKISPLARNVAQSKGIDFSQIKGTGEGGRIVKRDVEIAAQATPIPAPRVPAPVSTPQFQSASVSGEELSKMRQTIAQRMVESKTTIPHFYMTAKVDGDALQKMRTSLKALPQYEGVTLNHFVVKASAQALGAFPRINAGYANGKLVQAGEINVGIVTALPDGLLIPILKRANEMHLADIVAEGRALVQRARAGRPKADDLTGGTFSISNVGALPVEHFSAIISPGQGAILAVSSMLEEPVVKNGAVVVGNVFRITLSVDHRIIDGVLAGEFLKEVKRLLEDPVLLLA